MCQFFENVTSKLEKNPKIYLNNGNFYTYVKRIDTLICGESYDAFEYQISPSSKKRISKKMICSVKKFYDDNNTFPEKKWFCKHFCCEVSTRSCNISVAKYIVLILMK